jgi:hypothetical protein
MNKKTARTAAATLRLRPHRTTNNRSGSYIKGLRQRGALFLWEKRQRFLKVIAPLL